MCFVSLDEFVYYGVFEFEEVCLLLCMFRECGVLEICVSS